MIFDDQRSLDDIIDDMVQGDSHRNNVTCHRIRESTSASYGVFPDTLNPRLIQALQGRDILRPYSHQARAFERIMAGDHIVLTTPTASGKSLCYNVPILNEIMRDPASRALYIFPTKALSQDQYNGLHELIEATETEIGTFTFDGDTHPDARRAVRDHGHVVITNPDMLHAGILPQHAKWLKLFENLKYVVIDELHTYRGVFGSHVGNVLRRLRRICAHYGSHPQFILCSATIANPIALAEQLTGIQPRLITESGAPTGDHHIICYNPPVVNLQLGIRAGVVRTSYKIAADLIASGISTIVFAGSRLNVEVILKYLREAMERAHLPGNTVQGYRGGYLPQHRRKIEAELRNGTIKGVVATNALELGIDIGSLQACVIAGYPGSIASLWQQSGRAGRRSGQALTVFVARSSAIDQYMVNHPDALLEASPEHARLNPENLFVLVDHVKCAAFELSFQENETYGDLSTDDTRDVLKYLTDHGVLHETSGNYHWMERVYPATHVNLRGVDEQNFVVIDLATEKVLAEVDFRSTHTSLHDHAIYHVDGKQYQVERLDYDNHKAFVRQVEPDYYTTAMTYSRVAILERDDQHHLPSAELAIGEVLVTQKFVGFKKVRFHTHENVGYGDISLPDLEMHTSACWLTLEASIFDTMPDVDQSTLIDGLVGLSHALHTTATITLMCTHRDIGRSAGDLNQGETFRIDRSRQTKHKSVDDFQPTIFLYDNMPGGVGLATELFKQFGEILSRATVLLKGCRCDAQGCPACLGAMPAYNGQEKTVALALALHLAS